MVHLEEKNLSAWLFKVSIYHFYDLCRREKRYPNIMIDENLFIQLFRHEETGESVVLSNEQSQKVQYVLNQLKPSYRNLLILKYDHNLSYAQMAEVLDMIVEKIRTFLYRARNELKMIWSETDEILY